ncbi:hypothetical protein EV424DRAFT_1348481 [Suillus variegatus]|nr:hypothetical protein EV424DRAFT_1348481 [Suillus variegatus]
MSLLPQMVVACDGLLGPWCWADVLDKKPTEPVQPETTLHDTEGRALTLPRSNNYQSLKMFFLFVYDVTRVAATTLPVIVPRVHRLPESHVAQSAPPKYELAVNDNDPN